MMTILGYVDFAKLCQVIKYFTQLNNVFGKEDITLPILSSSISFDRQKNDYNEIESCLSKIDTRIYHNFTTYILFWRLYFFKSKINEI